MTYRDIPTSGSKGIRIQLETLKCPFCGNYVSPQYLYGVAMHSNYNVFTQCTNPKCNQTFITEFYADQTSYYYFNKILPMASPEKKDFGSIINDTSKEFTNIYNQAYAAEQLNLNQICGVGYRKALEFLIKDYLKATTPKEQHEAIEKKFLSNCINDDVTNENIKAVAKRAVWLGNDETHYVRKWEDKDVQDLKKMIDITIRWIESEIETKDLLEEMPEGK
jgi:hypothetical protein